MSGGVMRKMRLMIDCEHGEAGKVLDVDDCQVLAFLSEGKSELVVEPDEAPPPAEPEPVAPKVAPKKKGIRGR